MREFALLFGLRLRSLVNSARLLTWGEGAKSLSTLMIFGGFAVGVFVLTRTVSVYLLEEVRIGQFLFHRFLGMLLYVFFITVNLGNMIVSYATLYRSQEVGLLMSLPVPHTRVFFLKFVDNFFYSSSTLTMVCAAVLFGYSSAQGLGWAHTLFIALFVLGPFMLIAGLSAVLVLMSLISVATRIGVRLLLALIALAYLGAVWLYFRAINPTVLVQEVMKNWPDVDRYFAGLDPPVARLLPSTWVSEYLYWTAAGDPGRALPNAMFLIVSALLLLVVAFFVARRHYYATWLAANDAHSFGVRREWNFQPRLFAFGGKPFFTPATDVLLRRDFLMFFREPAQWMHLAVMAGLIVVFVVSVGTLELSLGLPVVQTAAFLIVLLFDGFLVASIALRFVFPMVSIEGNTFWAVRAAPVSLERLYWQKFFIAAVPLLPIAVLVSVASMSLLGHSTPLLIVAGGTAAFLSVTLVGVNLGAGAYFAVYAERNPIRIASSQGASLTFLGCMGYLALVVASLAIPLKSYFQASFLHASLRPGWVVMPLAAVGILSVLVFWVFSTMGLKSLRRDF
jgi:ABC-2 type transport system permease protein